MGFFYASPGASVVELPQPRALFLRPFRPTAPACVPNGKQISGANPGHCVPNGDPETSPGLRELGDRCPGSSHPTDPCPERAPGPSHRSPANKSNLSRPFRAHGIFLRITRGIGRRTPSAPGSVPPALQADRAGMRSQPLVLVLDPACVPNGDRDPSPGPARCIPSRQWPGGEDGMANGFSGKRDRFRLVP